MWTEKDLISPRLNAEALTFETKWQAPSNIALVKYWGKKSGVGPQIPANASVSFTLSACKTETALQVRPRQAGELGFQFSFEGKAKPSFEPKLHDFLQRITPLCPYLDDVHLTINSSNTFPHSSGIASSASGMAALSAAIMAYEQAQFPGMSPEKALVKASWLARLGSGSACRSLGGPVVLWGQHEAFNSADEYGTAMEQPLHPDFQGCHDSILLIDTGEKQVSSTVGHGLMQGHPFAAARFEQAKTNLTEVINCLQTGDWTRFIALVESEALTLHAMMMTSQPYFILMRPNTLAVLEKIGQFRHETGLPLCYTLDAGANVHLLYADSAAATVKPWIERELSPFCHENRVIHDQMGLGAGKF
jgi:diphosphomevalonate decarboxylase